MCICTYRYCYVLLSYIIFSMELLNIHSHALTYSSSSSSVRYYMYHNKTVVDCGSLKSVK